jgi:hypothetical protein
MILRVIAPDKAFPMPAGGGECPLYFTGREIIIFVPRPGRDLI